MVRFVGADVVDLSLDADDALVTRAVCNSLGYAQPRADSAEASRFCGWIGRWRSGCDGVFIGLPRDVCCLRGSLVLARNRTDWMGRAVARA